MNVSWPWQPRTVRCSKCGYLYFSTTRTEAVGGQTRTGRNITNSYSMSRELPPSSRTLDGMARQSMFEQLLCFRHAALGNDLEALGQPQMPNQGETSKEEFDAQRRSAFASHRQQVASTIDSERSCEWYTKYVPAHGPEEHR